MRMVDDVIDVFCLSKLFKEIIFTIFLYFCMCVYIQLWLIYVWYVSMIYIPSTWQVLAWPAPAALAGLPGWSPRVGQQTTHQESPITPGSPSTAHRNIGLYLCRCWYIFVSFLHWDTNTHYVYFLNLTEVVCSGRGGGWIRYGMDVTMKDTVELRM